MISPGAVGAEQVARADAGLIIPVTILKSLRGCSLLSVLQSLVCASTEALHVAGLRSLDGFLFLLGNASFVEGCSVRIDGACLMFLDNDGRCESAADHLADEAATNLCGTPIGGHSGALEHIHTLVQVGCSERFYPLTSALQPVEGHFFEEGGEVHAVVV